MTRSEIARGIRLLGLVTVVALASTSMAGASTAPDDAVKSLQEGIAADVARNPTVPGEILAVRAPGLKATIATGVADRDSGAPLEPDTPFRIASVTKTFVAAAILRLVEEAKLSLDDPITRLVSSDTLAVLAGDGYDTDHITVRQLLLHTAGLFDYAHDNRYLAQTAADPAHRWTRREQLELAVAIGDPVAAPGEQYSYSDTGYILLGEILERANDSSLPAAARALLPLDELGLDDTYWETLEPTPPGAAPRAHQYFGTLDNITLDASTDLYGGGGLVSTVSDLARFYRALFTNKVFEKKSSLRTMTQVSEAGRADGAAMGIFTDVDAGGEACFGHTGFFGTQVIYCPALKLTFARTINQALNETFTWNILETKLVEAARQAR